MVDCPFWEEEQGSVRCGNAASAACTASTERARTKGTLVTVGIRSLTKLRIQLRGKIFKFDNPEQTEQFPFLGVFDFEAILESCEERKHVPSSCCLLIARTRVGKIADEFLYRSPDCVQQFIQKLNSVAKIIPGEVKVLSRSIQMTSSDAEQHASATHYAV
ncbi:hypothetical protein HPB48_019022 [Haemaphysalis longicornis]|uniref:Uncharacterized protein n=1 Tax=Haemaphysalis longicornis TaxID=44386 RepID=A0A9J6FBW8_HAELO|nr:hypothetical protein HPB48_019022 [Haemaphysalis longicornis]